MKLLITGAWRDAARYESAIRTMGHEIIRMPDERAPLPDGGCDAEGIICNGLFLYHPLAKFPNLKYIQLTSAGFDRVPMDEVRARSIAIYNARGVYSTPMAEFALLSVLSVYRAMPHFFRAQEHCAWEKHRSLRELSGKCVCIVGCGSVGSECARRFAAMGCRVVGVDAYPRTDDLYEAMHPVHALPEVLRTSDVVVLTLPLTAETFHLMKRERILSLPEGAVLVNIARGGIVDTAELVDVLHRRPDLTAVLDVFEEEPLPASHPLWTLPNVCVYPHNSFVGEGNDRRLWEVIRTNLNTARKAE